MCYVYAIGNTNDLINKEFENCYIGVAKDVEFRWNSHTKSKYTVGIAIRDNLWTFEKNCCVVFEGSAEDCFIEENRFRPFPLMGLNEASGGRGGYTAYTEDRAKKISIKLKGRIKSPQERANMSAGQKGVGVGEKNPNARKWIVTDPKGVEYRLIGNLQPWCVEMNISWTSLRGNLGTTVGPISEMYRDKGNILFRNRRSNTIGWKLCKEN